MFSADLYKSGREDLSLFYFPHGANYAVAYTQNSVVSESITWNRENTKNNIKALLDYFEAEEEDYSIPEIYNDLKRNYVNNKDYILYIHTKGASRIDKNEIGMNRKNQWREFMNFYCIEKCKDVFKIFEKTSGKSRKS